ncbi:MAG: MBL fold metallo-hydrolase [Rhodospirillaceae bacterium]|jgi:glyoxylase-like metal-dependent hydrolase (beta-lactamase superfamily II)|nr:MBL fold metallo-hydrolase [Rhodospirillaceae bacterium]MBT5460009.1 MBL fold metallo-hydrolase [Rhodospirillaceae bacterium]
MSPDVKTFFDEATNNATHVVRDPDSSACALIDTVLGFDLAAGKISTEPADRVISYVKDEGLSVAWILETHVHADHLTAAPYVKERLGGHMGIGAGVTLVQETFGAIYNVEGGFVRDGSQFDHLFEEDEEFRIGNLEARVIHTPGHTPACVTYAIGNAAFSGDTFFMPDSGTARCDFPGGSATQLYQSLKKILSLPPDTRLFINHDYGAGGSRDFAWETTVAEQAANNIHVGGGTAEDDFVAMREERDATLSVPRLILPAIQVNMRAGHLPPPEDNGTQYLKIPLNLFGG